ncbi:MAG: hypothetical protein FWG64_03290 [Firmicutes bacterium]|nr:hypothetical protein [Bacillota bacterium]
MKLHTYRKKIVKIIDIDGDIFIGYVDNYTSALDDPDGMPNIDVIPYNIPNWDMNNLLGLNENEISSIEIIEPIEITISPQKYKQQVTAVAT